MMAAAAHVVVIRYDLLWRLKVPIDLGWTIRGRRVFGNNKTWRGALVMIAGSSAAMTLQQRLRLPSLELFDYGRVNAGLCGGLLGLGFVVVWEPEIRSSSSTPAARRHCSAIAMN